MESNKKNLVAGDGVTTEAGCCKSKAMRFLSLAALAQVLLLTSLSLLPAFFPLQAIGKGANSIEVGLIIGICFLALAVVSIPWGVVTTRFSSKLQLVTSIALVAIFTLLFGLVYLLPNGAPFMAAAFILRILAGGACCIYQVAAYTMIPVVLVGRENLGFSVMEMSVGLGYILGPALGGVFFDIGGFFMPFGVTVIPLVVVAILFIFLIQNPVIERQKGNISWKKILFCPCAILYSMIIFSTETNFGFLAVTLETALIEYKLSHSAIGGIILCSGATYALTTPLWGHMCDKGVSAVLGSLLGTITACVVFFFLGPIPWLPFGPKLWLIIVCVLLCGLAVAAKMVCAFKMIAYSAMVICEFPDNMVTYSAISAIFTTVVSAGAFAGPFIGGVLLNTIGMRGGTAVMFFGEVFLVFCQLLYIVLRKCRSSDNLQMKPEVGKVEGIEENGFPLGHLNNVTTYGTTRPM